MVNRTVSVHAGIYGIGIYAIMLPSSGFSVAHCIWILTSWGTDVSIIDTSRPGHTKDHHKNGTNCLPAWNAMR